MVTNGVTRRCGFGASASSALRSAIGRSLWVVTLLFGCVPLACAGGREGADEIWVVSARHLGNRPFNACCCKPRLSYQQHVPCHGWVCRDECQYWYNAAPGSLTIVYVHGNRIRTEDACEQGLALYRRLRCCIPADQPIRFVIWSWPSSPIPAALCYGRDARVKYRRTDAQSIVLAQWLAQSSPDSKLTLVGYSYGARLVLGSLHLLGGGCLSGCRLPSPCAAPACVNIALWAAATENCALARCGQHGCALNVIHRGLITVNRVDPALRRFRRVIVQARQRALGHTGLCCAAACRLDPGQLGELNVTSAIGRRHQWDRYCCSRCIIAHTARIAMDHCDCAPAVADPQE